MNPTFLDRAALVVGHPDDENLWCSSVLGRVSLTVLCYGEIPGDAKITAGRRAAVAAYPLPGIVALELVESKVLDRRNWRKPEPSSHGLVIRGDAAGAARYRANFDVLCAKLAEQLKDVRHVLTHNPWGEYGNEEHVQVHRAVTTLAPKLGYDVWFTNYVSSDSAAMMAQSMAVCGEHVVMPTQPKLAASIADLYKEHGCWTWYDDWRWLDSEAWIRWLAEPNEKQMMKFPVNMMHVRLPGKVGTVDRVRRKLGRMRGGR